MRNNNSNNTPKMSVRLPAARQGADMPENSKRVVRLSEERRKGTKYQIVKTQYLTQANKKETIDRANDEAGKKENKKVIAAEEISEKKEKEKNKSASEKKSPKDNSLNDGSEDEHTKAAKAAAFASRLQTNVDLNKSVPPVTLEPVVIHVTRIDSVYEQGGTAKERALKYKEKADFYLNRMKKDVKTGEKKINENHDKDVGGLYKKAYKLAHKEDLLDKKTSTMFDKAQSAMQFKSEFDNALNQDSTGAAAVSLAAIPLTHAATTAVKKLSEKSNAVMVGKTAAEISAKITESISSSDNVGEATVNAVIATPKYLVEKKVEKTVSDIMKAQHQRSIEAKKERLRQKQEKVEKRAQEMKKENMKRKMKINLYKSEHGITASGNSLLKNAKAAVKAAIEAAKAAASGIKAIMALSSAVPIILTVVLIVIIILIVSMVVHPFNYVETKDSTGKTIYEEMDEGDVVRHYHTVMDKVVDEANDEIPPETINKPYDVHTNSPIYEGYKWSSTTDGKKIPKNMLYNESLAALAAYNSQNLSDDKPGSAEFSMPPFEYLEDNIVENFYLSMKFWTFRTWQGSYNCPKHGKCCWRYGSKGQIIYYCPGHYATYMELKFNFNMYTTVFPKLNLSEEYMDIYDDGLKEINKSL